MSRKEKLAFNKFSTSLYRIIRDNNLEEFDFELDFYAYYENGIEQEYSRLVISYPSLSTHRPGFERALENLKTHVSDFLRSRFNSTILVESECRDSYETNIKTRVSQIMGSEIIPIIVDGSYIGVRADDYARFKGRLGEILAGTRDNLFCLTSEHIVSYDVRDDLLPLKSERGSDSWDFVSAEFYRLGLFHYANIPLFGGKPKQNIFEVLSARQAWSEKKGNSIVDITGFDDRLSEIIREEIGKAPDSENAVIVLPVTGMTKVFFEVLSDKIITRDTIGDYYKVLLFEGKEIVLATEEYYDLLLWFMSARSNFISLMMKHRDFFNDKLESKSLEWVLEHVRVTDSLDLSERERFLLESFDYFLEVTFWSMSWCEVRLPDRFIYNFTDQFNRDFRDRFKVLDSRVGRFVEG